MPPSYPRVPASYPNPGIILSNEGLSKSLGIYPTLPTDEDGDDYGVVITYDIAPPEKTTTLNIKFVKLSVYQTYESMIYTRGATLTITTDAGEVCVGIPLGISRKGLGGTELFEVDIVMRRTI